ncbi:hypothetical protein R0799_25595, partial [Escherichia coli]
MGSCAAPSAKGDDKFITTDYLQQCLPDPTTFGEVRQRAWKIMPREALKSTAQRMSVKPVGK